MTSTASTLVKALSDSVWYPQEWMALMRYALASGKVTSSSGKGITTSEPDSTIKQRLQCYSLLNATSRSFARVIAELHPSLSYAVCLFYLVLRALDTVEDDMGLPIGRKAAVLIDFHTKLNQRGWNFTESSPTEKDRIVLVDFHIIIDQLLTLETRYQATIQDITRQMGFGMAEYISGKKVISIKDYDEYCYYVAGLVGHGLTRLFVDSGLECPELPQLTLGNDPRNCLANTMGLFLQKVNIMKDFLGDLEEGRLFWPKEVWEKYVPADEPTLAAFAKPQHLDRALACLNHLILLSLRHVPDTLEYMSLLQDPTVFQFCAIPQMMALSTLLFFFNNPRLFQVKGNKIRRGQAVLLMEQSGSLESVKQVYLESALALSRANAARVGKSAFEGDSFLAIGSSCANIVRWIHAHDRKVGRVGGIRRERNQGKSLRLSFTMIISLVGLLVGCAAATFWSLS